MVDWVSGNQLVGRRSDDYLLIRVRQVEQQWHEDERAIKNSLTGVREQSKFTVLRFNHVVKSAEHLQNKRFATNIQIFTVYCQNLIT